MAHLAVVGTHSTNGVAEIHSDLLRTRVLKDFAEMYPGAVQQQDQRRHAAPLAASGEPRPRPAHHGERRRRLDHRSRAGSRRSRPLADDAAFRDRFQEAQPPCEGPVRRLAAPDVGRRGRSRSIFDSQIKRIHEYKRQLLNVLHIVILYNRLRARRGGRRCRPRTFFFAGKAAPAYQFAKLIIKLINDVAAHARRRSG